VGVRHVDDEVRRARMLHHRSGLVPAHTHPLNRLTEGAVPPHCTKADGAQARGA
jgi:hypothetical protein